VLSYGIFHFRDSIPFFPKREKKREAIPKVAGVGALLAAAVAGYKYFSKPGPHNSSEENEISRVISNVLTGDGDTGENYPLDLFLLILVLFGIGVLFCFCKKTSKPIPTPAPVFPPHDKCAGLTKRGKRAGLTPEEAKRGKRARLTPEETKRAKRAGLTPEEAKRGKRARLTPEETKRAKRAGLIPEEAKRSKRAVPRISLAPRSMSRLTRALQIARGSKSRSHALQTSRELKNHTSRSSSRISARQSGLMLAGSRRSSMSQGSFTRAPMGVIRRYNKFMR